jgi:D-3-phosphoglycerate dehydrogenase
MTTYRILVSDPMSPDGLARLRAAPDAEVTAPGKMPRTALLDALGDYDALIVRSETKVDGEVLERAARLKVVGRAGVGLDNVELDAATARGIIVMNTPGANAIATCEHTFAMILALCRKLPQADASLRRGEWTRSRFLGVQLFRKTLGIIGLGRIGQQVAQRAQAFGMETLGYDPYISADLAQHLNVTLVSLDDLLARADFITLHTVLTPETHHLIGRESLARVKPGARLINCARGELVDEAALVEALTNGQLAGAALDVYSVEPPTESPLLALDNVVLTPHLGASTEEAQRDVSLQIVDQVLDALRGVSFRNAVNFPFVDGLVWRELRPYLDLAERIGALQTQLMPGRLKKVEIELRGPDIASHAKALSVAVLKGLLTAMVGDEVNYINAPILAAERGIAVAQSEPSAGLDALDYLNLISCRVLGDQGERLIAGTLFSREQPRIVQMDGFRVDAPPTGIVLVMLSHDAPGVIGRVGTLLGEHGINIAEWRLGRDAPGGNALSFINLDNPIPPDVLARLLDAKDVISAKVVRL